MGTDSGCLYSLSNKGVDIEELCLAQLDIDAAENIDCIGYGLPVEGHIILDLKVKVTV